MNPASSLPRATIVMTARERHALAETAIESVVRNTAGPYRFIYADVQSPPWLRDRLARRAAEWNLEVIRVDGDLWPNHVRRQLAPLVASDYVVYIDNDVIVDPGWLDAMVACADETGAGVVAPLYLWGDGHTPGKIHVAGGKLAAERTGGGMVLTEAHYLTNRDPVEVPAELVRRPCDFAEFHCMLVRRDLVQEGILLDPDIVCVHEHIDVSIAARQKGFATYFEPGARVTYLATAEFELADLPFFRKRWSRDVGESSIAAFARKWNVANDDRSFGPVRGFLREHVQQVDPLRPSFTTDRDRAAPMARDELAQTRSELLDLAVACGYDADELAFLVRAYQLAMMLTDGGYRPCGRPFVNHLAGTASVLARYGFRVEVVAAGLLHAVYTHCRELNSGPQASVEAVCLVLGGRGSALESRVRAYTDRGENLQSLVDADNEGHGLTVSDAEIVAIAVANEIDMLISGEFRYSGRSDAVAPATTVLMVRVCEMLGVPGMAATLRQAAAAQAPVPAALMTNVPASYRFAGYSMVAMASNAYATTGPPRG